MITHSKHGRSYFHLQLFFGFTLAFTIILHITYNTFNTEFTIREKVHFFNLAHIAVLYNTHSTLYFRTQIFINFKLRVHTKDCLLCKNSYLSLFSHAQTAPKF